jgi:thiol:disulfide interchange protein DsbC
MKSLFPLALAALLAACSPAPKPVDEAALRARLAERMPNLPKIDAVKPTAMPGVVELHVGGDILYADTQGDHLLVGQLYDTRTRTNVTEERLNTLNAIDFAALPLKDAMVAKQGSGARKLVVFADPNCGYCKGFERDLAKLQNVTIYTFLYPVLGPDSEVKSRDIWCAKDAQSAWRGWMLDGVAPPRSMGSACDTGALARNTEFGRKHRMQGTPTVVFEDGKRAPGAIPLAELEKRMSQAAPKS